LCPLWYNGFEGYAPKERFVFLESIIPCKMSYGKQKYPAARKNFPLQVFRPRRETMIKCHLSRMLGERKLKIADVARDTGIHRGTITRLYQETAVRIELDVIDRLCRYLGCQVGDLLEYREEEG